MTTNQDLENIILEARESEAKRINNNPLDSQAYKALGAHGMIAFDRVAATKSAQTISLLLEDKDRTIQSLTDQLKSQKQTTLHWHTKCAEQQEEIADLKAENEQQTIRMGNEYTDLEMEFVKVKAENEQLKADNEMYSQLNTKCLKVVNSLYSAMPEPLQRWILEYLNVQPTPNSDAPTLRDPLPPQ